jgi:5-hydroxyisourate hydrolase
MSEITTHVLDAVLGRPAAEVAVRLEKQQDGAWMALTASATDAGGRCRDLAKGASPGLYRLTFFTSDYLARNGRTSIYPEISISFHCSGNENYHLPLLLSDNSYTTYRGS